MSEKKQPTEYSSEVVSTYQTGSTSPPNSHAGIVAFLLSVTIFICGVSTIFSLMRINLLQKVIVQAENQECAMAFASTEPSVAAQANPCDLQIHGRSLNAFWQNYRDLPQGVYVTQSCSQPLCTGDIILSIDRTPVSDWEQMNAILSQYSPGDRVTVTVYRNEKQLQLTLTINE